jgi:hypothetical protein
MKKIKDSKPADRMTRKQLKRLWKHSARFPEALKEWKRRFGGSDGL